MMKLTAAAAALCAMISLGGCAERERETEAVGTGTMGGAAGEAPAGGRTADQEFETRTGTDIETRRESGTGTSGMGTGTSGMGTGTSGMGTGTGTGTSGVTAPETETEVETERPGTAGSAPVTGTD